MAVWTGINQGYRAHKANVLAEKNLQLSVDELDIRSRNSDRADQQFKSDETMRKVEMANLIRTTFSGSFSPVKTGSGSGGSSTANISTADLKKNMAVLTTRFQIPAAEVQDLHAKGGASAVVELVKMANTYSNKFKTGEYLGETPSIVVGQMLSDAIFTQSEEVAYDWNKINEQVGFEVNETIRTMVGSGYVIPGTASFEAPALIEKVAIGDLDKFNALLVQYAKDQATTEFNKITNSINSLTAAAEGDLTRDQEDSNALLANWLSDRMTVVDQSLKSYKDGVYGPLIGLYGATQAEQLEPYYTGITKAPLDPSLSAVQPLEISVPNREIAGRLWLAGILTEGMLVRNLDTNKIIPIEGMSGE